ncbi:MAG: hypothetical protein WCR54_08790 [Clostridia bacterium]
MKKRINLFLIIIGVVLFLSVLAMMQFAILSYSTLWVKYLLMFSLLLFFIGFSKSFKKVTDINEANNCLNSANKSITKLCDNNIKKTNRMEFLLVTNVNNQLKNAVIYLTSAVDQYDLYSLKDNILMIKKIINHYRLEDSKKRTNDNLVIDKEIISDTIAEISQLQKDIGL